MKSIRNLVCASILLINYPAFSQENKPGDTLSNKVRITKPALSKRIEDPSISKKHMIKGDSLKTGRIYYIWCLNGVNFIGEVIKIDSLRVRFRDNENEHKKISLNKIYSAKDITVDSECYGRYRHKCVLYLTNGAVLDNVRPRMITCDSLIYRDTANAMHGVNISCIQKIMFYETLKLGGNNPVMWLMVTPLLPLILYEYAKYDDPEFDLSYMDLKWKKTMIGLFLQTKYVRIFI